VQFYKRHFIWYPKSESSLLFGWHYYGEYPGKNNLIMMHSDGVSEELKG